MPLSVNVVICCWQVDIATLMYEKGMLITAEPLRPQWSSCDEDDDDDDE